MAGLRDFNNVESLRYNNEGIQTKSSVEQEDVETRVHEILVMFNCRLTVDKLLPRLNRQEHIKYLKKALNYLPPEYKALDASRPWLCYWIIHGLTLLDVILPPEQYDRFINFLARCQHPEGGFSGSPGQYAHLAPTYAAVNALCTIGTERAYSVINRPALHRFLMRMRQPDGSFTIHQGGEIDVRGSYCALSVAALTNVLSEQLLDGVAEWLVRCQTYEGGFGACPGMEAHGGYTFCGLAALFIARKTQLCDAQALLRWTANRQMRYEGGFQGRTNKLVDGCYSFWQGGSFPLIHELLKQEGDSPPGWLFDSVALQEYILICCQAPDGGCLDKPGKNPDVYHTCYTISGLSTAQNTINGSFVLGPHMNKVGPTHPIFNISNCQAMRALQYFKKVGKVQICTVSEIPT